MAASCLVTSISGASAATVWDWQTVADGNFLAPGADAKAFFSFNQPSLSETELVVFRARARDAGGGGGGSTVQGVYIRDMSTPAQPIQRLADSQGASGTLVPDPNNTGAVFLGFPSFPRIDVAGTSAFRGQHQPVWEYSIPPVPPETEPTESRAGTAGAYVQPVGAPVGDLTTGASQLGFLPDFSYFEVPDADAPGTKFDQFPGAPSPSGDLVAVKGNWTDATGAGQTGIYVRDIAAAAGESPMFMLAERGMAIPEEGGVPGSGAVFGSTSPPSASGSRLVFTGLDNEDAPTAGGIYIADMTPGAPIAPLVDFGDDVPGEGQKFNRIGEALSFNGGKVAFWGAWGTETRTVTLTCPTDGNADLIAACIALSDDPSTGTSTREVPVHQGVFVVDADTGAIEAVAKTGEPGIDDLTFWNFSGAASGGGDSDAEDPRWRQGTFAAINGENVIFKALDLADDPADDMDLLFIGMDEGGGFALETILGTGTAASFLDSAFLSDPSMRITEFGIERDGYRAAKFAISVSFLNDLGESWAGIYLASPEGASPVIPLPMTAPLLAAGLAGLGLLRRRRRRVAEN